MSDEVEYLEFDFIFTSMRHRYKITAKALGSKFDSSPIKLRKWLEANTKAEWFFQYDGITEKHFLYFMDKSDAMRFKLVWA